MKLTGRISLAAINAIGFSATTIMPLWIGGIAAYLGAPGWFAGLAVFLQVGMAAICNLGSPLVFRNVAALPLARIALAVATIGYLSAAMASPVVFLIACMVSGGALGVLLNVTNRMMGSVEHVQSAYALFVLIEVIVATAMFLGGAWIIAEFGLWSVFLMLAGVTTIGVLLLATIRIDDAILEKFNFRGALPNLRRAILCLAAFALFMMGQGALNSFMPIIGQNAGLDAGRAAQYIGFGMPAGFVGALLAKLLGERMKPAWPIFLVVLVLSATAFSVIAVPSTIGFVAAILTIALCTMLAVPYFFAILAGFDDNGRYTAPGPAMMLAGIAIGPSVAVLLSETFGLMAVAYLSTAALLLSAALLLVVDIRRRQYI